MLDEIRDYLYIKGGSESQVKSLFAKFTECQNPE
jgi:hypothetical protein